MKIIESEYLLEQFRFPRSRKKRIRNKWAKRPENFRPSVKAVYQMGDTIICHPKMAALIRKTLRNNNL